MGSISYSNKIGVLLNLVFSFCFIVTGVILLVLLSGENSMATILTSLFFIIGGLVTFVVTYFYYKFDDNSFHLLAGILGLFFGLILGGLLVLQNTKHFK